jgi:hypothetical protein
MSVSWRGREGERVEISFIFWEGSEKRRGAVFFEPNQKIWFNCQPLYYKSRPRESIQRYFFNQVISK